MKLKLAISFLSGFCLGALVTLSFYEPDIVLALIAVLSFTFVVYEFLIKKRPYIDAKITPHKSENRIDFSCKLKNVGDIPAYLQIKRVLLRIGDEPYPTPFSTEILLYPGVEKHSFDIGHINALGLSKIKNSEYTDNTVEIELHFEFSGLVPRIWKFQSIYTYEVLTDTEPIQIKVKSEKTS